MTTPAGEAYKQRLSKRRVILFCVIILIGCIPASLFMLKKSNEIKEELKQYEEPEIATGKEEEEYEPKNNWLKESVVIKEWTIPLPQQVKPVTIKLYLHSGSNMLLLISSLPQLPEGEKYQVWAVKKEDRQSLGLFNAPGNDKLIIDLADENFADSYDITIVKGQ